MMAPFAAMAAHPAVPIDTCLHFIGAHRSMVGRQALGAGYQGKGRSDHPPPAFNRPSGIRTVQ